MNVTSAVAPEHARGHVPLSPSLLSLLALGVVVMGWVFVRAGPFSVSFPGTAKVLGEANLRVCPRLDCEIVATLERGRILEAVDEVTGERALGTDAWYQVTYGNSKAYVSTRLLDLRGISGRWFELILTGLGTVVMLLFGMVATLANRPSAGRYFPSERLYLVASALGIGVCTLAFVVGQSADQSLADFWQGALINLGSGLLGAAVAFVLFEALVRRESEAALDRIALDVAQLRDALAQVEDGLRGLAPIKAVPDVKRRWRLLTKLLFRGPLR
jgi:hypothetical protein